MARIRTIKPDFWEDEKLASLPMQCRLFYIGTWTHADDLGVFRANPSILKSKIFPYDEDLRISEVKKWLDALVDARMIIPIIHNGESYYVIRTFQSHQKIDKRYGKPLIEEAIINQLIRSHTVDTPGTHCGHTGNTPQESNSNGMELGMENNPPLIPPEGEEEHLYPKLSQFDDFRKNYPGSKRGNETEFSNFKKKHKDWKECLPLLYPSLENQIKHRAALQSQKKFVPEWKNLQTWINQRCWEETYSEETLKSTNGTSNDSPNSQKSTANYKDRFKIHS